MQGSAAMLILAGDAGGTKTRLALYEKTDHAGRNSLECSAVSTFDSKSAPALEEIVLAFLDRHASVGKVGAACIGIPGPIVFGTVRATNLP
ncbi:glucokinase, partial [bacterium]